MLSFSHTDWELALADQGTFNLSFSCHHGGLRGSCYSCLPILLSLLQTKDPTDSRSRGANSASNRVSRGGTDRHVGRGGSNQYSSTGMWLSQSKSYH